MQYHFDELSIPCFSTFSEEQERPLQLPFQMYNSCPVFKDM